jgi:peptidyl-prolyl cis-trans isomerase B (cyclophilin B)
MRIAAAFCAFGLVLGLAAARAEEPKGTNNLTKPVAAQDSKGTSTNEVAVFKTSEGEMVIAFWPDVAPKTVENFKTLARKGFYDGTIFHRIIKGFMIQGGDPFTKNPAQEELYGTGDPGYKIDAEFNNRAHERGVISMARNGDPQERFGMAPRPQFANSAGSQFFICHDNASSLNGKYTAFGKLIKGDDVLEKIANTPVSRSAQGEPSKPVKRVEIQSIKIVPLDSIK